MRCLAALAVLFGIATGATAQTRVVRVPSKLLGEERIVHVHLPPNYDVAMQRYEVIYLLDGHVRPFFDITVAAAAYDLTGDARTYATPPQIVVGVDQRVRGEELGRNQELFTRFLVEELVPYIDHEYRTSHFRTLIGHSLGGRFALMTFCRAPGVFPAVIAISGAGGDSTGADATRRCLEKAFASDKGVLRHLVLGAGDREVRTLDGVRRLQAFLRASAPSNWRWTVIDGTGLGHTDTPLATIPPGIRFVQSDSVWDMPPALIEQAAADPERAVVDFHTALGARVGSPVSPSLKSMLAIARARVRQGNADASEAAIKKLIDAYPEDLEGYGMLSDVALRRNDTSKARRALDDAMRMLERLDYFDVYDRERKRQVIKDALAAIPR
ncbi:MAG: hypothetical protein JWM95_1981 [Gemmatimonadetes bacterium]|nr:hypothetical protein [Gemmatimonadota bacterium]